MIEMLIGADCKLSKLYVNKVGKRTKIMPKYEAIMFHMGLSTGIKKIDTAIEMMLMLIIDNVLQFDLFSLTN